MTTTSAMTSKLMDDDDFIGGDELPESFQPSRCDVIVGWARQNYNHEGNQMLRALVRKYVPRYMEAKTKHDKGTIIVEILETIQRESPSGLGLLRQNPENGRWSYIGHDKAKDKIGHALRKASSDYQRGVKGSPVKQRNKQQRKKHLKNTAIEAKTAGIGALQSLAAAPSGARHHHYSRNNTKKSSLEDWHLASVTSSSSSESHGDDIQIHPYHHNPVQVTVPSSPVTRPSSVASNQNNSCNGAQNYSHQQLQSLHEASSQLQNQNNTNHFQPMYNQYSYGSEGYDYHNQYYYQPHPNSNGQIDNGQYSNGFNCHGHKPVVSSLSLTPEENQSDHGQQQLQQQNSMYATYSHRNAYSGPHSYHGTDYPAISPPSCGGELHRIFDEVVVPQQQEEKQQYTHQEYHYPQEHSQHNYHYHPQQHYQDGQTTAMTSTPGVSEMPYSRIVSHDAQA